MLVPRKRGRTRRLDAAAKLAGLFKTNQDLQPAPARRLETRVPYEPDMNWLFQLQEQPVAQATALALVCMAGMALGASRLWRRPGYGRRAVRGHPRRSLRQAGEQGNARFRAGIRAGAVCSPLACNSAPASLRRYGSRVKLNALAATIVIPAPSARHSSDGSLALTWQRCSVCSGASVNMPSLGAATQTAPCPTSRPDRLALPALACAVAFHRHRLEHWYAAAAKRPSDQSRAQEATNYAAEIAGRLSRSNAARSW